VVEARATNHRFLDVHVRLPPEIADHASAGDATVRKHLERGRIDVGGRIEGTTGGDVALNADRAGSAFRALSDLRDEVAPGEPIPLSLLAAVPELFTVSDMPDAEQIREAVRAATEQACGKLTEMRETEGAALATDLKRRIQLIRDHAEGIGKECPEIVDDYRAKLRRRIEKLVDDDRNLPVDPGRLEHEIALFADRSDVSEELTRLQSHCDQFSALITPEPTPVGRRMEFLLQEMLREVNTVGSKISDLRVTRPVIDLKTELERVREQVQNVV
jgi:uncharacterized protein (TIGR00255 family)